jgi:hypothetical protein
MNRAARGSSTETHPWSAVLTSSHRDEATNGAAVVGRAAPGMMETLLVRRLYGSGLNVQAEIAPLVAVSVATTSERERAGRH